MEHGAGYGKESGTKGFVHCCIATQSSTFSWQRFCNRDTREESLSARAWPGDSPSLGLALSLLTQLDLDFAPEFELHIILNLKYYKPLLQTVSRHCLNRMWHYKTLITVTQCSLSPNFTAVYLININDVSVYIWDNVVILSMSQQKSVKQSLRPLSPAPRH